MDNKAGTLDVAATLGDGHLIRMAQVKRQVRGRRIAFRGLWLQTAQNHLLHPLRQIRLELARRWRIHPQSLPQAAGRPGRAKRQFAGGEFIKHHADRKNIAARVAAHTHHLLGRNPGWRADRLA